MMRSDPCWGSSTEDRGMVLAPLERHPGRTPFHPPSSILRPPERRARGPKQCEDMTGGQGRSSLPSPWLCRLNLSWAQQRKINHSSNGRSQGWPRDCLIRCKITPQVWLLDPKGSNPTASDQTRIRETLPRVKRGETEQPVTAPSFVFSYQTEKPDNEGFKRRKMHGQLRFDTPFHFCCGSLITSR